ncbi:hypothetical protein OHA98_41465 [Streptomyces sp. NBC_00654]|uniref:hypothetical protein n=1 Tax=Streptomyces sp. NBC_00654 TaxID=2975799 RepID=UPI00224F8DB4|nr:hypothetical protein [Streptomyces sp. NBC_00654]MCX4971083.1 hypothetical protein [Streptomyces sp. NBC_00654]
MYDYDDFEDRYEAEAQTRRRQAADLDHIATYYALDRRLGIRVAIGGRVRHDGREGTVVDTAGQRLMVLFEEDEVPRVCHVTSGMAYETAAGWVEATPGFRRWEPVFRVRRRFGIQAGQVRHSFCPGSGWVLAPAAADDGGDGVRWEQSGTATGTATRPLSAVTCGGQAGFPQQLVGVAVLEAAESC